jgi:hypothetical protein
MVLCMLYIRTKLVGFLWVTLSASLLTGCMFFGTPPESTKDQCNRFTVVMQQVFNGTRVASGKYDREALTSFTNASQNAARTISTQNPFNDPQLRIFQDNFVKLFQNYANAGQSLVKVDFQPQDGFASLNTLKQNIPNEKPLFESFNNYCRAQGYTVNL